jgi:hypothetical protein
MPTNTKLFQVRATRRFMFVMACVQLLLVVALLQLPVVAKCISLQMDLNGNIVGPTKDLTVLVEVASATEGDSDTEVRQKASIEEARFQVLAWFNTTSNVISVETCDRKPRLVIVKLMQGEQVLDRQTLTVERDFSRTKSGGYQLKRPITLHRPADK